ncbi:MAG: condensation domain-containing protein, partial [Burkholderiaceae bacterium]|nr:condensation domain-containing protein [Burkholderiaceae bacterium]
MGALSLFPRHDVERRESKSTLDICNIKSAQTLFELLRRRARSDAGRMAFGFLDQGETLGSTLTFDQLDCQARCVAALLQQCTRPGDRVMLVFPAGLDYVVAFWACVYARVIAVPALAPASTRTLPRLLRIVEDARPAALLTLSGVAGRLFSRNDARGIGTALDGMHCLSLDQLPSVNASVWREPASEAGDIAFLQYTSGSTSAPRGVMVSHANVLANLQASHATYRTQREDTGVSWLPAYHDFGLVGGILYPIFAGCCCIQFAPAAFLTNPFRWLKALSDYRAQFTGAPNFAYELCINKVSDAQRATLDLSALKVALNGAERVRLQTLRRFQERFAACGLATQALRPSYGLAESVVFVSAAQPLETGQPQSLTLVRESLEQGQAVEATSNDAGRCVQVISVGSWRHFGQELAIVDAGHASELPERWVGEIWLRGPSVAQGYWHNPEQTAQTFGARLADGRGGFLRTGDLGFVADGQLYVTGRAKELIILNGRNIYPQDIEVTIEQADPAFRVNGCAVFTLDEEQESALVAVQEVDFRKTARTETLAARVMADLAEQHELTELHALVLVKPGQIPRTSSGKIQRLQCRRLYLQGQFQPLWHWQRPTPSPPSAEQKRPSGLMTPTETALAALCSELLGGAPVSLTDSFFSHLGGNSLLATQLAVRLRAQFKVDLPLRSIFEASNLSALAAAIDAIGGGIQAIGQRACTITRRSNDQTVPASYAQQRLWFLDQLDPGSTAYSIPYLMRLSGTLDAALLERSMVEIVRRHEALRTTFAEHEGSVVQCIHPYQSWQMARHDLSALAPEAREAEIGRRIQQEVAQPFDLSRGPLLRVSLLRESESEHLLLLNLHHSIGDGGSLELMLTELGALVRAFGAGQASPLTELPIQYADYAQWEREQAESPAWADALDYWAKQLAGMPQQLALPTDRPRQFERSQRGARQRLQVPPELARQLRDFSQGHGLTAFMTLLAAFQVLLWRWSGQRDFGVGVPVSGRSTIELEGLIGMFVNTLVMRAPIRPQTSFLEHAQELRQVVLDGLEHQQLPLDRLVQALAPQRTGGETPLFQVMFVLQSALPDSIVLPGLRMRREDIPVEAVPFDLSLVLHDGESFDGYIEYTTDLFDAATIERMSGHFIRLLTAAIQEPQTQLGQLPLMDAQEWHLVVKQWNQTQAEYPSDKCIHELFERQAERTPEAMAVECEGR